MYGLRGDYFMSELGKFLRELRGKESLRSASRRSGVSHNYLRIVELGVDPRTGAPVNPSPETLKKLSDAYKHPYKDLMEKAGYLDIVNMYHESTIKAPEFKEKFRQKLKERNLDKVITSELFDDLFSKLINITTELKLDMYIPFLLNEIDKAKGIYGENFDYVEAIQKLVKTKVSSEKSEETKEFISVLDLSDEEIMKRFPLEIDGRIVTEEEYKWFIASVRAKRLMEGL